MLRKTPPEKGLWKDGLFAEQPPHQAAASANLSHFPELSYFSKGFTLETEL